jgi:hypothetical protein
MSLLNRSPDFNHLYDSEGRLQGGLSALEELALVIASNTSDDRGPETMDEGNDDVEPARELPVTNPSHDSPSMIDSDEDMSDEDDEPGSSDDDAMEEIVMYDEPNPQLNLTASPGEVQLEQPPIIVPSSPNAASLPSPSEIAAQGAALSRAGSFGQGSDSDVSTVGPRSHGSRRSSRRAATLDPSPDAPIPIGEKLKRHFLDMHVLSSLMVSTSAVWLQYKRAHHCPGLVL